jgi:hypothetical protein
MLNFVVLVTCVGSSDNVLSVIYQSMRESVVAVSFCILIITS